MKIASNASIVSSVSESEEKEMREFLDKVFASRESKDRSHAEGAYVEGATIEMLGAPPVTGIAALNKFYEWQYKAQEATDFTLDSIQFLPRKIVLNLKGHFTFADGTRGKDIDWMVHMQLAEQEMKISHVKICGDGEDYFRHVEGTAGTFAA